MAGRLDMEEIYSFYKGKKVFITGHTGFKGSWLSYWLLLMGANVTGYSIGYPTQPSLFKLLGIQKDIKHIVGDVRNQPLLQTKLKEANPDICFHLAAQPLVRLSYENPLETYTTNMNGTLSLLESIRLTHCLKTIVLITSDKCYENKEWDRGYIESDCLGGYDPYSSSKACAEIIIQAYRRSFLAKNGIGCASARAGNVIGGGDWSQDRLIVDCVRSLIKKQELVIRYPNSTRPWQHVLEPLCGYLVLGKSLYENPNQYAEPWNFGPREQRSITVEELVQKILQLWGSGSYRIDNCQVPHEAGKLQLDIHKACSRLDWHPRWDAEKAIEETITWYKAYYQNPKVNVKDLCEKQIKIYLESGLA